MFGVIAISSPNALTWPLISSATSNKILGSFCCLLVSELSAIAILFTINKLKVKPIVFFNKDFLAFSENVFGSALIPFALSTFNFILDYEVPEHVQTIVDDAKGNIEIYKLDYVDVKNISKCEYITFDPEINFLKLTGVSCDQNVDDVIDEDLRDQLQKHAHI